MLLFHVNLYHHFSDQNICNFLVISNFLIIIWTIIYMEKIQKLSPTWRWLCLYHQHGKQRFFLFSFPLQASYYKPIMEYPDAFFLFLSYSFRLNKLRSRFTTLQFKLFHRSIGALYTVYPVPEYSSVQSRPIRRHSSDSRNFFPTTSINFCWLLTMLSSELLTISNWVLDRISEVDSFLLSDPFLLIYIQRNWA